MGGAVYERLRQEGAGLDASRVWSLVRGVVSLQFQAFTPVQGRQSVSRGELRGVLPPLSTEPPGSSWWW